MSKSKKGRQISLPTNLIPLNDQQDPASGLPLRVVCKQDKAEMVLVPAGEFQIGFTEEQIARFLTQFPHWTSVAETIRKECPPMYMYLEAYYIEVYPVTNARYRRFIAATGHRVPAVARPGTDPTQSWVWDPKRQTYPPGTDDYPVGVSGRDALAYCGWAGKALPTELEWEKAARGTDGRLWPWGDDWEEEQCSYGKLSPVGAYPTGVSPYGCHDMAGNIQEFCIFWEPTTEVLPNNGLPNTVRVTTRSGSCHEFPYAHLCGNRRWSNYEWDLDFFAIAQGFRCVVRLG
jgi:formylglycine-generating enzyme required for sulfatase activity